MHTSPPPSPNADQLTSSTVTRRGFVSGIALTTLGVAAFELGISGDPAFAEPLWGHPLSPRGVVSSHFRRPERPSHNGIDFWNNRAGSRGGDRIYSIGDGVVEHSGPSGDYGNLITVDHGGNWRSLYAHTAWGSGLPVGTPVTRGQHIATIGSTGRSEGPHLHLEIKLGNGWVDPEPRVMPLSAPLPGQAPPPPTNDPTPPPTYTEEGTMYYRATSASSDGLIQNGFTYVNAADGPLRALNSLEGGAVSYYGLPQAAWTGNDIRALVKIVGLRQQGAPQGLVSSAGPIINDGRLTGTIVY